MKYFILSATFILYFGICSFCQKDTTILYENGKVRYSGLIDKGRYIGLWYDFDINGDTVGLIEFFDNNKCRATSIENKKDFCWQYDGYFKNGSFVLNGDCFNKDLRQNIWSEGRYYENEKTGTWKQYKNGRLTLLSTYNLNDSTSSLMFFENNGQVSEIKYVKNNQYHGLYIDFDDQNRVKKIGNYTAGCRTGEWLFYDNGKLQKKGSYFPDYLHLVKNDSVYQLVNKYEKLAEDVYPVEVIKSYKISNFPFYIKNGKWEYYSDEGILIKEEFYEKGKLVETNIHD